MVKGTIDPTARNVKGAILTPEQIAAAGTEHAHQAAIFQWIATGGAHTYAQCLDLLFAVPNGGDRKAHVGGRMKAEGVKSGVPDMCWPIKRFGYAGLWIELKKPSELGKKNQGRSDKQIWWQKRLLEQGYAVVTAFGWQAACWVLVLYEDSRLTMPSDGDCFMATPCTETPPVVTCAESDTPVPSDTDMG